MTLHSKRLYSKLKFCLATAAVVRGFFCFPSSKSEVLRLVGFEGRSSHDLLQTAFKIANTVCERCLDTQPADDRGSECGYRVRFSRGLWPQILRIHGFLLGMKSHVPLHTLLLSYCSPLAH